MNETMFHEDVLGASSELIKRSATWPMGPKERARVQELLRTINLWAKSCADVGYHVTLSGQLQRRLERLQRQLDKANTDLFIVHPMPKRKSKK